MTSPPPHSNGPRPQRNGENLTAGESFAKFFECWLSKQSHDLDVLRSATSISDEQQLRRLVDQVIGHYEYYYNAKAAAAASDVLAMFSPSWTSTTENLFLWAGGWRPTAALHLLYSKSGLQLESQLPRILAGGRLAANLGSLSAAQLEAADRLQLRTVRKEREIDEAAAAAQEAVAAARMVELAGAGAGEGMEREMEGKMEGMRRVLEKADALRLEILKEVVALLRPAQAVHFLIAAAELHLAVHEFGRRKDAAAAWPEAGEGSR